MDILTCYNRLFFFAWHVPEHNILINSGDINVQIDKDKNDKFWLLNLLNRNDKYLADFSLKNNLLCLNTKSQKGK